MKINKEELVHLLVEKTGMMKDEITSHLDRLIQRIIDAAERGKALEIKEFGLFYFDDEGDLKFEPASEFSTEVNFKYAGMEPIELKPPRGTFKPSEEPEEETDLEDDPFTDQEEDPFSIPEDDTPQIDDPFGISKESPQEDPFRLTEDEPEEQPEKKLQDQGDPFDMPAGESQADEDPFEGLLKDASSKLSEEDDEPGAEAEEQKVPPKKKKAVQTAVKTSTAKSGGNPITMIIVAIMMFILAAAGYFTYIEFFRDSTAQVSQPVPVSGPDIEESTDILPGAEPEEIIEVTERDVQDEEELTPEEPVYGLMGQISDTGNDGFSIVVYSYNRESQARNVAANLSREGYRVLVTTRNVRGNPVWRVSLGQFATINQALEHAGELPAPFNTEHFIQRIQTN